jgi:hypothetical protein
MPNRLTPDTSLSTWTPLSSRSQWTLGLPSARPSRRLYEPSPAAVFFVKDDLMTGVLSAPAGRSGGFAGRIQASSGKRSPAALGEDGRNTGACFSLLRAKPNL